MEILMKKEQNKQKYNSLQLNNKFALLFILIFTISIIPASELSVSPAEIKLTMEKNQIYCQNYTIKTSGEIHLTDKWADRFSKDIREHNLNSDQIEIEINYPNEFEVINLEKIQICIIPNKLGNYHGVLLFELKDSKAIVGTWIDLTVQGDNQLLTLTGNAISGFTELSTAQTVSIISTLTSLVFLSVLLFLIRKIR
jgi:hypothetical protein